MKETLHIYTRVSTGVQEEKGTSLSSQREGGISYSEKHGFKYKVWNEGSQSSSKDDLENRQVLTKLLQEVDEGNIKHIYVYNPDRLSRNQNTWGFIRFKLLQKEVVLHTPGGKYDLTDFTTNLMLGILSEISQYENAVRTERFRVGKVQRIREGRWKGGKPTYGYDLVDGLLVINKKESKVVKTIYDEYNQGKSPDKIRLLLLEKGIPSPRGNTMWSEPSIRVILRNTHYQSYCTFTDKKTGETIHNQCPQLLTSTTISKYLEMKEKRTRTTSEKTEVRTENKKYQYLLTTLLECGGCGSRYIGNIKQKQSSVYGCRKKHNKYRTRDIHFEPCTQKRYLNLEKTDLVVWETVLGVVEKSHLFRELTKKELLPTKEQQKEGLVEQGKIQTKIRKLNREIGTIQTAIVNQETQKVLVGSKNIDLVIKQLERQRIELEKNKEQLTLQINSLSENQKWVDWYLHFGKKIKSLRNDDIPVEEKRMFLEGVVENIVVLEKSLQEHQLKIQFREPYVDDKLIWKEPKNKKKGYTLKKGKKELIIDEILSKKPTRSYG
jgi:site-specific DNA recombinase